MSRLALSLPRKGKKFSVFRKMADCVSPKQTRLILALEGNPKVYALSSGNDKILVAGKISSGIGIYVLNPETLSYKTIKVDGYGPLLKPVQAVFLPGRQYVAVGSEDSFVDILHDTGAISRIETDVNEIDWLAAVSKSNSKDVMLATNGSSIRNEPHFLLYTIREGPSRRRREKVV